MLHISGNKWFLLMVDMYKMIISQVVFSFYPNCDFPDCQGSKRAKLGQSEKKTLSATLHISGTIHFHLCIYSTYDNISRNFFFFSFYQNFNFPDFQGGRSKGQKIVHKNSVCCTLYLRNHASYDCHLWYTSVS